MHIRCFWQGNHQLYGHIRYSFWPTVAQFFFVLRPVYLHIFSTHWLLPLVHLYPATWLLPRPFGQNTSLGQPKRWPGGAPFLRSRYAPKLMSTIHWCRPQELGAGIAGLDMHRYARHTQRFAQICTICTAHTEICTQMHGTHTEICTQIREQQGLIDVGYKVYSTCTSEIAVSYLRSKVKTGSSEHHPLTDKVSHVIMPGKSLVVAGKRKIISEDLPVRVVVCGNCDISQSYDCKRVAA